MNVSTEKKIMNLEDVLVAARVGGKGGSGRDWEFGVNGCKLLLLEWIYNEILLCSIEIMSRYLHLNRTMGGKRMYTCMCDWVTILYSREKNVLGNNNKKERNKMN